VNTSLVLRDEPDTVIRMDDHLMVGFFKLLKRVEDLEKKRVK
jgi:hypothetical protein